MTLKKPLVLATDGSIQQIQTGDYLDIAAGGTGAGTAANARTALGIVPGTDTQVYSAELTSIAAITATGMAVRTADDTWVARSLAGPAVGNGLTITNGNGVAGNPTVTLANDTAAIEGLTGTGIAVRTGTDAWAQRTITPSTGIAVVDGNGVAGNPTIALATGVVSPGTYQTVTVDTYGRVTAGTTTSQNTPAVVIVATNGEAVSVPLCSPVYLSATGVFKLGINTASLNSKIVGLTESTELVSESGNIITDGEVTATTAQWDAVTGQIGGLTFGSTYFLAAVAGRLTTVPPTTGFLVSVGQAISTTKLLIDLSVRVQL